MGTQAMTQTAKKDGAGSGGREAVRMYSNNSLKEPVRSFEDTFSGFDLLKKHFSTPTAR